MVVFKKLACVFLTVCLLLSFVSFAENSGKKICTSFLTVVMGMSAAERMRKYRMKLKTDPARHALYMEAERERWKAAPRRKMKM